MDMSFANQALGVEYAVQHAGELDREVYPVPAEIDKEIARLKLETMGVRDRHAHRGAGEVPRLVGRGDLEPESIVRLEEDGPRVVLLDQRRLPDDEIEYSCASAAEVAEAIRTMVVRGAPAIGVAAAYGLALAALRGDDVDEATAVLAASRPTAVNLSWALAQMRDDPTPERARALHLEEVDRCRRMAAHAAEFFGHQTRALTHCNAGGLATGGYGSAVGALRTAWERGVLEHVLVDETRPLLQGARLTAWSSRRPASRTP